MTKGIAITCVDPRLHARAHVLPGLMGVNEVYNLRYGGPDGIVVHSAEFEAQYRAMIAETKRFLSLGASAIAFASHTTCAGHPVDDETHCVHTREAVQKFRRDAEVPPEIPIHAFLDVRGAHDGDWRFESLGTF